VSTYLRKRFIFALNVSFYGIMMKLALSIFLPIAVGIPSLKIQEFGTEKFTESKEQYHSYINKMDANGLHTGYI
jgi:predicted Na+-dependent transporter